MNGDTQSQMSRKAAIAGMAIPAIAASDDWRAQAIIAGVASIGILAQAVLDWKKNSG
jgi:hypothetical protein